MRGLLERRQPSHHQLPHRPRGCPGNARSGTVEADRHGLSNDALREFLAHLFLANRGFFGRFAERFCSDEVWLSRTTVSEPFFVYSAALALRTGTPRNSPTSQSNRERVRPTCKAVTVLATVRGSHVASFISLTCLRSLSSTLSAQYSLYLVFAS